MIDRTLSITRDQLHRIRKWIKWPDVVVILTETELERVAARTGLMMPPAKKLQAKERQGRVIAVGPETTQCAVGDHAWYLRFTVEHGAGQNVRIDGAEAIMVPEGNVLCVESPTQPWQWQTVHREDGVIEALCVEPGR